MAYVGHLKRIDTCIHTYESSDYAFHFHEDVHMWHDTWYEI